MQQTALIVSRGCGLSEPRYRRHTNQTELQDSMDKGPRIGDAVLGGRYSLLAQVKGSIGGGTVFLGTAGRCRYCGQTDRARFRTVVHAFPEALGNKWIISRDECDACNQIFSKYDDAITRAVSPFLTLGGVKGKSNKVRQTGRSEGDAVISRRGGADGQGINMFATNADPAQHLSVTADGLLRMNMPVADAPFRPRRAYKALVKMGIALLPEEELDHYTKLRAWLLDADDMVDFPNLDVGMSFASVGKAPPIAVGALLRRTNPTDVVPHILFIFSAGSICLQIDLMSDHLEDHLPPVPTDSINIEWSNIIFDPDGPATIAFRYGKPVHLNWSSLENEPQPVEAVILSFNPQTCAGSLTPIFR
ncbi:hypothetical protein LRP30_05790 [Bradyrhizobium sp. C-145]|uniref:HNH endonuclease n=1 Tax=Bradyrhizobium sp. C-145 TaxID=574727 RepID=UPI00201B82CB|nr:HNH endonuclease [Bradyrhizobium sp. C-145]UQR64816.1 hypothetical protein LRP30_05790 [Bradyrhizobium sp. C-145]